MSSPTPRVVVRLGSLEQWGGMRAKPHASAASITAVTPSPRMPQRARTRSPTGPVTWAWQYSPPVVSTKVSSVSSPPSATGRSTMSADGRSRRTPRAMASAASRALRLSLNAWGATTIRIGAL